MARSMTGVAGTCIPASDRVSIDLMSFAFFHNFLRSPEIADPVRANAAISPSCAGN
jgi:hypothetical protein